MAEKGIFTTAVNDALCGKSHEKEEKQDLEPDFMSEGDEIPILFGDSEEKLKENGIDVSKEPETPPKTPESTKSSKNEEEEFVDFESREETPKKEEEQPPKIKVTKKRPQSEIKRKRPPSQRRSQLQTTDSIPADIKNNPYVAKRLNIYPVTKTKAPRAATACAADYRRRKPAQLDEYTTAIYEGRGAEEEPTIEQLRASSYQLRNLERDLVDKSDYVNAKRANKCYLEVSNRLKHQSRFNDSKTAIEELIAKRNELNALIEHVDSEYCRRIDEHNEAMSEKAKRMMDDHQAKLDEFDENVPTDLRPLFKRNSVTYHKMRSAERHLALTKNFDAAIRKKREADRLERIEEENNYEKMNDYYREKKMRLLEHQRKAVMNFMQYADGRLLEIKAERAHKLNPMLTRVEKLNRLIEKMCEKRGVKIQQLDLQTVDNERVERLKTTELGDFLPRRPATTMSKPTKTAPIRKPRLTQTEKL